jgi:hypothetical protein
MLVLCHKINEPQDGNLVCLLPQTPHSLDTTISDQSPAPVRDGFLDPLCDRKWQTVDRRDPVHLTGLSLQNENQPSVGFAKQLNPAAPAKSFRRDFVGSAMRSDVNQLV